jgi:hypothetical protein
MRAPPIPNPCTADWAAMSGSDTRRHCATCDRSVHDLSAMAPSEADALIRSRERLCVRYLADAAGAVLFAGAMSLSPPAFAQPGTVSLVLVDAAGTPVPNVVVMLQGPGAAPIERRADADGRITVPEVPGRYFWRADAYVGQFEIRNDPFAGMTIVGGDRLVEAHWFEDEMTRLQRAERDERTRISRQGELKDPRTEERNRALLARLGDESAGLERDLAHCPNVTKDVADEVRVTVEIVDEIVKGDDAASAPDVATFVDGARADLDAALPAAGCEPEGR